MKKLIFTIGLTLVASTAMAENEVGITKDMSSVTVQTANGTVEITRIQDITNQISGEWALTSRPCPNF